MAHSQGQTNPLHQDPGSPLLTDSHAPCVGPCRVTMRAVGTIRALLTHSGARVRAEMNGLHNSIRLICGVLSLLGICGQWL